MIFLPGYKVGEQICQTANSVIYRGVCDKDLQPVYIKILNKQYPSQSELTRFRREFEIIRSINSDNVIKAYALEKCQHSLAMILEDFKGQPVSKLLEDQIPGLTDFLRLSILMAEGVDQIHQHHIIHRDINPRNIIWNPETSRLKIIDFNLSTRFHNPDPEPKKQGIEERLAYISPEQTGRINIPVDYRSDYYSFGVMLYQILTHRLPFCSTDPIQLIHSHIAAGPIAPYELNSQIPKAVSDIIMKLMLKNPQDRYQSIFGLQADLMECLTAIDEKAWIEEFELGKYDFPSIFQLPQKIYGREKEIDILVEAQIRVNRGGKEVFLIAGSPGTGKSSIISEFFKTVLPLQGFAIYGKFNQLDRNAPYSAITSAFRELILSLASGDREQMSFWKQKLSDFLEPNAQVMIDIIPELELIIGRQSKPPELPASEAQNRFTLTFLKFLKAFLSKESALTISLDDLQWADEPSFSLIESFLVSPDIQNLLFIGAYRDNEVDDAHPLMSAITRIERSGVSARWIFANPLDKLHLRQIISEALLCPPDRADSLVDLVIEKTKGNPFFSKQLLQYLYDGGQIVFDTNQLAWTWDTNAIRSIQSTENVVALMVERIQRMPEAIKRQLEIAACIGESFDLQTLYLIGKQTRAEAMNSLLPALDEGFVVPANEVFDRMDADNPEATADSTLAFDRSFNPLYRFSHDRIWHVVYSMLPDEEKQKLHLKIGFLYLEKHLHHQRDEGVFKVVHQLNCGIGSLYEPEKRLELAQLNLIAGKKAKASAAFRPSLNYFNIGISLLAEESWKQNYALTFELNTEAAESAFFCMDFEKMEQLAETSLRYAKTVPDQSKIYSLRIQKYYAQNELLRVVEEGLAILKPLGYRFPKNPNKLHVLIKLARTLPAMIGRKISKLNELEDIDDPATLAAMRIMTHIGHAAYGAVPNLTPLVCFQGVLLSLKYGIAPESPFAFAGYGMILCSLLNRVEAGFNLGKIALVLNERGSIKNFKARAVLIFGSMISHWKNHLQDALDNHLMSAHDIGLRLGDFEYSTLSAFFYGAYSYFAGRPLKDLAVEMSQYSAEILQCKQNPHFYFNEMCRQVVLNLMGESEDPTRLIGEAYDEDKMLPVHEKNNDTSAIHMLFLYKLQLCFLFGKRQDALKYAQSVEKHLESMVGTYYIPVFYFYDSLVRLSALDGANKKMKRNFSKKVYQNQKKLKRWARHAPMNYLSKWMLVEAERFRVTGNPIKAMEYYDRSISLAAEHGYRQEEALGNELAAMFWLGRRNREIAEIFLKKAVYCYDLWGAKAKVDLFHKTYPQLLQEKNQTGALHIQENHMASITSSDTALLDLKSVIKAYQTISSEIFLDELMRKLMTVVIENAGAQRATLVSRKENQWIIHAEGRVSAQGISISTDSKTARTFDLPFSILNLTASTYKTILLHSAVHEGTFTQEPYIQANRSQAILSAPVLYHGKMKYTLLLENNLIPGAFTQDRLELIQLLAAQAAISLENAELLTRIQESENKYRSIFEQAVEGIFQIGREGGFISVNTAMANILGYDTRDELMAASQTVVYDFFADPEDRKKIGERLSAAGMVVEFEGRGIRKDGREFWGALSIRRVLDSDGELQFYEGSLIDITERIKRQKAEKEREAAEAIAAIKSAFLANMSHEIRTPMNAIIGLTELLSRNASPENRNEYIAKIKDASKTLLRVIDDILDFSKIEAGKLHLENKNFSISDIYDQISLMFSNLMAEKQIRLTFSISKEIPETLYGDPFRLGQVMMNLVSNAHKFTQEGEICIQTELVERGQGSIKLRFLVKDTGIGISEEKIRILFQPFTQADGSITRRYGGTGLGLAICKSIVDKMGGRIWAESREGIGSSFIFEVWLGYREDADKTASEGNGRQKVLAAAESRIPLNDLPKDLHILLVEDNPINARIIEQMLECAYIKVRTADNGENALKLLDAFDHDAVLMDVQMPDMDGYEVTRRIRQTLRGQNLPIIALTAHASEDFRKKCIAAGMNDYVTKPIDFRHLLSTLSLHLNMKEPSFLTNLPPDEMPGKKENQDYLPENLPGINVAAGLKHMAGRRPLYLAVLREFYNDYKNIPETIQSALKNQDAKFIYQMAHTIKGLAGHMGAEPLKSAAQNLEEKAKKNGDAEIESSYLEEFNRQLTIVLRSVKAVDSYINKEKSNTDNQ